MDGISSSPDSGVGGEIAHAGQLAIWVRIALRCPGSDVVVRMSGRLAALTAGGIVVIGFAGGALSGKLEHTPGVAPGPAAPTLPLPTTTSPTPTTTTSGAAGQVRTDVLSDMSLDMSSLRLDPNPTTRAAIAATAPAVAERHADIALAWAPDRVAAAEAANDARVAATASNPAISSFTAATFVVTSWGRVTIDGTAAAVTCVGHYVLSEPEKPPGVVTAPDQRWSITLRLVAGRWRLETRAS